MRRSARLLAHLRSDHSVDARRLHVLEQLLAVAAGGAHHEWHAVADVERRVVCTALASVRRVTSWTASYPVASIKTKNLTCAHGHPHCCTIGLHDSHVAAMLAPCCFSRMRCTAVDAASRAAVPRRAPLTAVGSVKSTTTRPG